jgi:hypothetical protein
MLLKLQNNMVPELCIFMIVVITDPSFCLGMWKLFMADYSWYKIHIFCFVLLYTDDITMVGFVVVARVILCRFWYGKSQPKGTCVICSNNAALNPRHHIVPLLIRKVTAKRNLCNLFKHCSTKSPSSYRIMNIWLRTKWHLVSTDVIMSSQVPCCNQGASLHNC